MKVLVSIMLLAGLPVWGQIELPDFMLPETRPEVEGDSLTLPEGQRHVQTEDEREAEENEQLRQTRELDMIRRMRPNRIVVTLEDLDLEKDVEVQEEKVSKIYTGGPDRVGVLIRSRRGNSFRSRVENRTWLVETGWGRLPVRLHEIREATPMDGEDGFRLELVDGDLVEGRIPGFHLWVSRSDGSERLIPGREIDALQVSD